MKKGTVDMESLCFRKALIEFSQMVKGKKMAEMFFMRFTQIRQDYLDFLSKKEE